MRKKSTKKDDLDIPEKTRNQLGKGVRGKYFKRATESSNVVVLDAEIAKAFPTSEAVNEALAALLNFSSDLQKVTAHARPRRKTA